MADIRLDAIWEAIKARLSTERMNVVLYGTRTLSDGAEVSRVYRATDDYSVGEADEGEPWGRVVLIPVTTLWDPIDVPTQTRKVNFLTRVEFNNWRAEGYDVTYDLEATQEVIFDLLNEWLPSVEIGSRVVFRVYRRTYPQPMPMWDDQRKLWWTSAEYRFEAAKLAPI